MIKEHTDLLTKNFEWNNLIVGSRTSIFGLSSYSSTPVLLNGGYRFVYDYQKMCQWLDEFVNLHNFYYRNSCESMPHLRSQNVVLQTYRNPVKFFCEFGYTMIHLLSGPYPTNIMCFDNI